MDLGTEVNNTVMTSLGFFLHSTSQVWDWKIQKPQKGNKNRPKKKKPQNPSSFYLEHQEISQPKSQKPLRQ